MKTEQERIHDRDQAIKEARTVLTYSYYVLDTETTGLKNAQMCQIAVLSSDGVKYKSFVKPTIPIEPGATAIHHITNEMVEDAPSAVEAIENLPFGSAMVIYNAPFDIDIIVKSLMAHGIAFFPYVRVFDAMQIYSKFKGEWNETYGNYRWHKLGDACKQCSIELGELELHDALSDVIMTDKLIHYIADQRLSDEPELLDEGEWITE